MLHMIQLWSSHGDLKCACEKVNGLCLCPEVKDACMVVTITSSLEGNGVCIMSPLPEATAALGVCGLP